jgi:hypothetical protein
MGVFGGGWCTCIHTGVPGVSLLKNFCLGWEIFSRHTRLVIGDGTRVRFWHDRWCGDTYLKDDFPVLFSITHEKDASVVANVGLLGGSHQRNVSFCREAHDWEVEVFAFLFFFFVFLDVAYNRNSNGERRKIVVDSLQKRNV